MHLADERFGKLLKHLANIDLLMIDDTHRRHLPDMLDNRHGAQPTEPIRHTSSQAAPHHSAQPLPSPYAASMVGWPGCIGIRLRDSAPAVIKDRPFASGLSQISSAHQQS